MTNAALSEKEKKINQPNTAENFAAIFEHTKTDSYALKSLIKITAQGTVNTPSAILL